MESENSATVFRQRIYRPYLDLGNAIPEAPFHVIGLDWAIDSFVNGRQYPAIQASGNESFRDELTAPPLGNYAVDDIADLDPSLRSARCEIFVDRMKAVVGIQHTEGAALCQALSKLCFHREVVSRVPDSMFDDFNGADGVIKAELAYLRASSLFALWQDDPNVGYELSLFEAIAENAPMCRAKVDATYQMVNQSAKIRGDLARCTVWQEKHRTVLEDYAHICEEPEHIRLRSRYHRVGGFLPQMVGDQAGVADEMGAAEDLARNCPSPGPNEEIARLEMLFPCLESRMQEAIWIGDLDLALMRIDEYIGMKELDPRGWMHRANIHLRRDDLASAASDFAAAAYLAPPSRSIALFMRGQCLAELGDPEGALNSFSAALDDDPLAISALEAIQDLATSLGKREMAIWAQCRLNDLVGTTGPQEGVQPSEAYKEFPRP